MRRAFRAGLVLAVLGAGYFVYERLTFDRAAWLADYDQLRTYVSKNYANLLWTIDHKGVDPAALHQATLTEINAAQTNRAARAAIASFVSAFQDGHFRISRVRLSDHLEQLTSSQADEIAAETPAEEACNALGFSEDTDDLAFSGSDLQHIITPENAFDAATAKVGERTVGLLRISSFDTRRYERACRRAWEKNVGTRSCDKDCVDIFVNAVVPNQLLAELTDQVRGLARAGATVLAVDVTGNGGGTDWVEPAARIVAPKPLACARVSFIKGPHWTRTFSDIVAKIDADLASTTEPGDVALLQDARQRASDLTDRATTICNLDAVWTTGERPACSNLVEDARSTTCGLIGPLPKGSLPGARSRQALFHGLDYDYTEGLFAGEVAVLIDGSTASAAEYFAAVMADSDAATLLGQRTWGVGCGYTNGGVGIVLNRSGLKIEMPDCQRLRRDGTNEMAGVAPDIAVDWNRNDSGAERWGKLARALKALRE